MARPALKRRRGRLRARPLRHCRRRRACRLVRLHRSVFYYQSVHGSAARAASAMREHRRSARALRLPEAARAAAPRGLARLGRTLAYRLYREEELQLRSKLPRRRKMVVARRERFVPRRPNEAWSMDFVADQLVEGQRFRALDDRRRVQPRSARDRGRPAAARGARRSGLQSAGGAAWRPEA